MLVDYQIVKENLPPMPQALYQYLLAGDGVYIRAERPGLYAIMPLAPVTVRGLVPFKTAIFSIQKVGQCLIKDIFLRSYGAMPNEILFYLEPGLTAWDYWMPQQIQTPGNVSPVDPYAGKNALIEIHSHHRMSAFFSSTDDKDERSGFRVYTVIGNLDSDHPTIQVRLGIYGYFFPIPAAWVFDLPSYVDDMNACELVEEVKDDPNLD